MSPGDDPETDGAGISCPECGSQESGYFCRNCGTLLQGEDRVLCPRCHGIVPAADYCPRCGQGLKGMALNLQQLALAGEDFWVTVSGAPPAAPGEDAPAARESDLASSPGTPDIPDWMRELPPKPAAAGAPERVYPALQPLEARPAWRQKRFLFLVILLLAAILMGLVAAAILLLGWGGF